MSEIGDRASACGRLFVVSGPSGVGKDSVLDRVFARVPGVARSISATTRAPRPGERDGVDYHFLSRPQFDEGVEADYFFEYAQYGECLYGTPRGAVEEMRSRGLDVVLKIEVQGALKVRETAPDTVLVFIQPPTWEELERRLRTRRTEADSRIAERLEIARQEMAAIPRYDYLITNDDLESAVEALGAVIVAERHRIHPNASCPPSR